MQTAKISVLACLLIACAALTSRAVDSPAQAAARAALAAKLFELDGPTPPPTNAAVMSPAELKAQKKADKAKAEADLKARKDAEKLAAKRLEADKAAAKKLAAEQAAAEKAAAKAAAKSAGKVPTPPKIIAPKEPAVVMTPVANPDKAKAEKAQDEAKAAAALQAKQEAEKFAAQQREAEKAAANKQAEDKAKAEAAHAAEVKAQKEAAQAAEAAQLKARKEAEKIAVEKAKAEKAAAKAQKPASQPVVSAKKAALTPITAPASPIPVTKDQQLQELLAKYKADKISPQEYQDQRAAILAQP